MTPRSATIIVINDFGAINGGAARVAIDSARGLAARGHDVVFFCGTEPVDPRLATSGVRIVSLGQQASKDNPNLRRGAIQNLWNAEARAGLSRLLDDLAMRRVVVHVHGWSKVLSPSVLEVVARRKLPAAVTLHDYFVACPTGALFDFGRNENCPLTPMSMRCVSRQCDKSSALMKGFRVVRQIIQARGAGFPSRRWRLVGVSEFSLRKLRPFLSDGFITQVIANPNDMPRRSPVQAEHNVQYVAAGRLSAEKGMAVFALAAKLANVPATIIGDGETRNDIAIANPTARLPGWMDHAATLAVPVAGDSWARRRRSGSPWRAGRRQRQHRRDRFRRARSDRPGVSRQRSPGPRRPIVETARRRSRSATRARRV
jgi:glycosyltransferase involved in cell wall biosynthesis